MKPRPLILITPDTDQRGVEFQDLSVSLSEAYLRALLRAGALPVVMPATEARPVIAECVRRADGVLLTGGGDVAPRLYRNRLPPRLRRTVAPTPDGGRRDLRELLLIDEVFRQCKPLLAVCRGQQLLNVALGGSLVVDIAAEVPGALNHRRMDRRSGLVHEVRLTRGSLLADITGQRILQVNSTHHQAVGRVAPPLRLAGVCSDGVIEALELKPGAADSLPFLLSVQFHPERLADRYPEHRAVIEAFVAACARARRSRQP
jgi:putative glutamine amidotransferase